MFLLGGRFGPLAGAAGQLDAVDDVDAQLAEKHEDVVDLLDGELDVLQQVMDVLGAQVALLAALADKLPHLGDVRLERLTCRGALVLRHSLSLPAPWRERPQALGSPSRRR